MESKHFGTVYQIMLLLQALFMYLRIVWINICIIKIQDILYKWDAYVTGTEGRRQWSRHVVSVSQWYRDVPKVSSRTIWQCLGLGLEIERLGLGHGLGYLVLVHKPHFLLLFNNFHQFDNYGL